MKPIPPLVFEGHQKITATMMAELIGGPVGKPDFSAASIGSLETKLKQMKARLKYGTTQERAQNAEDMRYLGKKLVQASARNLADLAAEQEKILKSGDGKKIDAFWEQVRNTAKTVDFAMDFWLSGTGALVEMGFYPAGPNNAPNAQLTKETEVFRQSVGGVAAGLDALIERAPATSGHGWGHSLKTVEGLKRSIAYRFGLFAETLAASNPGSSNSSRVNISA